MSRVARDDLCGVIDGHEPDSRPHECSHRGCSDGAGADDKHARGLQRDERRAAKAREGQIRGKTHLAGSPITPPPLPRRTWRNRDGDER